MSPPSSFPSSSVSQLNVALLFTMPLAAHVDVDSLVKNARDGKRKHHGNVKPLVSELV